MRAHAPIITGLLLVALMGCGSDGGDDNAEDSSGPASSAGANESGDSSAPAEPDEAEALPTTIDEAQFCDGIDEAAVAAVIGEIGERQQVMPGDTQTDPNGKETKATYYQCGYGAKSQKKEYYGLYIGLNPDGDLAESKTFYAKDAKRKGCVTRSVTGQSEELTFAAACDEVSTQDRYSSGFATVFLQLDDGLMQCGMSSDKTVDQLEALESLCTETLVAMAG